MRYYRIVAFVLSLALMATVVSTFSLSAAPAASPTVLLALRAQAPSASENAALQKLSGKLKSRMARPTPMRPDEVVSETSRESPGDTEPEKGITPEAKGGEADSAASGEDTTGVSVNTDSRGEEREQADGPGGAGENPPVPSRSEKSLAEVLANYHARLTALIEAQKSYPEVARRLRHQGIVQISFVLAPDGALVELAVADSSGHAELDEAALNAVHAVPRFPAFPAELGASERRFAVSLNFVLE
jgi:protein TonB